MMLTDRQVIERFIEDFRLVTNDLELHSEYLELSPEGQRIRDEAISILKHKLQKIEKAESMSDLKKVIKINKLLNRNPE